MNCCFWNKFSCVLFLGSFKSYSVKQLFENSLQKFTGKRLHSSLFLIKVQAFLWARGPVVAVISCELSEVFQKSFFTEHFSIYRTLHFTKYISLYRTLFKGCFFIFCSNISLTTTSLRKKCPHLELFWSLFFLIRAAYRDLLCKSPVFSPNTWKLGSWKLQIPTLHTIHLLTSFP